MSSPLPPTRIRRSAAARGAVAGTALMCAVLMCTAGCGSGFNAASLDVKPDSGTARIGGIRINNVVVVADPATGNAEVIAAVANTGAGPEQLVSVTAAGLPATVRPAATVAPPAAVLPDETTTVTGNTVTIEAGSAVSFGQPGRPELEISGGSFKPGNITHVELGFANAGQATVNALTMSNTGLYEDYNPNGPNTPSGPPSPSPTASPKPSNSTVSKTGYSLKTTPSPTSTSTLTPTPISSPSPSPSTSPNSVPTPSPAASAAGIALAKASTALARTPHLHGSREPRR